MHSVLAILILISVGKCSCNSATKVNLNCSHIERVTCDLPRLHTELKPETEIILPIDGHTVEEIKFPGHSQVSYIPYKIFRKCPNVKILSAHDLKLHRIDSKIFEGASNLEKFLANGNLIEELVDHNFLGARNLKLIELYDNKISYIAPKAFGALNSLEILQIGKNTLKDLDQSAFLPLVNLKVLYIHHGDLTTISKKLFSTTTNLEEVYMDNQKIKEIEPNFAERLTKLRVFKLIRNPCVQNLFETQVANFDTDLRGCYQNYRSEESKN